MGISYQIEAKDSYLYYVAKGQPKDTDELVEYLHAVFHEAHSRGFSYGLVDETDVQLAFDVYDPVIMTDAIDSMSLSELKVGFAVVAPRYCSQLYEYFASVLRKRSLNVTVYKDVAGAREWITGELASRSRREKESPTA